MKFQFLLASLFAWNANGLEKSESMDQPFQASTFKHLQHSPCVGLYHRNGRAGCGTVDRDIQSGPLHYHDGQTPPEDTSYVAVLEEYRFTSKIISNLMANSGGLLQGILVLNGTVTGSDETYLSDDMNTVASPGPIYPLGYSTPSADIAYGNTQYPWNGNGDGLNQYDLYGVPIVYVNEEGASAYIRSFSQNQQTNDTNQIFTDFTYYMGPDGIASKECLTWQDAQDEKWNPKCLPLGGTSVWGFAGSPPTQQVYKYQQNDDANGDNADAADDNGNGRNLANKNGANVYQSQKPAIILGTSIDSTSMFHDLAPGANEGASNTLTLLMAAYLLGQSVNDATLDALNNRIVFGFFEGEAYGYLGSRNFLNDVLNFSCDNQNLVNSVAKNGNSELACLYPMRPSMKFKDIGEIAGVLTVDQVGIPTDDEILYVHNDGNGDFGTFLANVLKASGTNDFTVADSEAANNNDNGGDYPYPPTALNALQGISGGAYSGAVLTGYDYVFPKRPPYQSHLNWAINSEINLKSIASAATLVARTALAAAYDDGSYDYETASNYAVNTIGALAYNDEVLVELANCLLVNGNCNMLNKYASQEAKNERDRTGFDIGAGASLGYPPNYYVGVYSIDYGQPFVRVGDKVYGSYNDGGNYGAKGNDAVGMQPRMLQQAIRNMLHDFLGRGQINGNAKKCGKESDCDGVAYCATEGDSATCSAKSVCVCKRAYYHTALDTSLTPAANEEPGFFSLDYDDGKTPIWTEPFWSSSVGVKMYRDSASGPGFIALGVGVVVALLMFNFTKKVKSGLQKEKVY
jgi:nicastrin